MVAKAGGYYDQPFRGYRRRTQGDPLPHMSFNVLLETVI